MSINNKCVISDCSFVCSGIPNTPMFGCDFYEKEKDSNMCCYAIFGCYNKEAKLDALKKEAKKLEEEIENEKKQRSKIQNI